jgi:hypothetical protein
VRSRGSGSVDLLVEEDEQRAPGHDLAADAMEDDASLGQRMKTADERSDALESIKVDLLRSRKDRSVALSTSVTAASRRASPSVSSAGHRQRLGAERPDVELGFHRTPGVDGSDRSMR